MKRQADTLCWTCRRATDSSCAWVRFFEPVKGWRAEETVIFQRGAQKEKTLSFIVKSCPLYVKDDPDKGKRLTLKTLAEKTGIAKSKLQKADDEKIVRIAACAGYAVYVSRMPSARRLIIIRRIKG